MAMFGVSPIANTHPLDFPPPQHTGAQSSGVNTAAAQPAAGGQVDRVVPCSLHTQFGLAPIDGYTGIEQQLVPVAPHGQ
eukprot:5164388-Amphidinium_carterae.1